jgi:hypothetical protein
MSNIVTVPDWQRNVGSHSHRALEDESSKELLHELVAEGKRLLREEARLMRLEVQAIGQEGRLRVDRDLATLRTELANEGKKAARAGTAIGVASVLGHAGLLLALFAAVFGIATWMPLWLAALVVAAVVVVSATIVMISGVNGIKRVSITPRRTIEQLQEDTQWMREKWHALKSAIRANG